jgi:hypothetical protein
MSNFKSNNKFDVFNKEYEYDNKPKYPAYNQFKSYNSVPVPVKKDFEINDNDFPDLAKPIKAKSNNVVSKSFASLLEKKEIIEEIKKEEEIIVPPGWSYYKYTKFKNGMCGDKCSILTSKIQKPFIEKNYEIEKSRPKVELNEAEEIIEALTILHEKRTNEYKELWGELEWERMFVCPNYDYEYFDKLDEAYEIEQCEINEQYYNQDDDDDY